MVVNRMKNVGEEIREALVDNDKEALEAATHPDHEVVALKEQPGYNRLLHAVNMYYRGAAERNLDEGGNRNDYWRGVRAGLTLFFVLIGDSEKRLRQVEDMQMVAGEDVDLEPGADFVQLGGSAL
jgi:hypothetical protein